MNLLLALIDPMHIHHESAHRQVFESDAIITHAQVTDVYLLGLAVQKGGKLATLDQRIPVNSLSPQYSRGMFANIAGWAVSSDRRP